MAGIPVAELSLPRGPVGAPNVVLLLLDDVGFGASEVFGDPVSTPAVARLAPAGLRDTRFHATAICSPTRASLLTGRDAHVGRRGHGDELGEHAGESPLAVGEHVLEVDLDYDGGGLGQGAWITLRVHGAELGSDRTERTPRGFFSIDETFDIGATTGSPVGNFPRVFHFDGDLHKVEFRCG